MTYLCRAFDTIKLSLIHVVYKLNTDFIHLLCLLRIAVKTKLLYFLLNFFRVGV